MPYFSFSNAILDKKLLTIFPSLLLFFFFFGRKIKSIAINQYCITFNILAKDILLFSFFLRNYTYLRARQHIDSVVQDSLVPSRRFTFYYNFLSLDLNIRFCLVFNARELLALPSLGLLYKSSFWSEREIWDLFGIFFLYHKDLRRILTDYGFSGHPLRKDFPLSGFTELFYDDAKQSLYYTPVALAQEYRVFNFKNPWKK